MCLVVCPRAEMSAQPREQSGLMVDARTCGDRVVRQARALLWRAIAGQRGDTRFRRPRRCAVVESPLRGRRCQPRWGGYAGRGPQGDRCKRWWPRWWSSDAGRGAYPAGPSHWTTTRAERPPVGKDTVPSGRVGGFARAGSRRSSCLRTRALRPAPTSSGCIWTPSRRTRWSTPWTRSQFQGLGSHPAVLPLTRPRRSHDPRPPPRHSTTLFAALNAATGEVLATAGPGTATRSSTVPAAHRAPSPTSSTAPRHRQLRRNTTTSRSGCAPYRKDRRARPTTRPPVASFNLVSAGPTRLTSTPSPRHFTSVNELIGHQHLDQPRNQEPFDLAPNAQEIITKVQRREQPHRFTKPRQH